MFTRIEFERTTPESVGIASHHVMWLLDQLESGFTEPHGLMIMRQDRICAEGWWQPYAPGICHAEQSLTKTFVATAIGIAYTEGLLNLDDRIIDIFKEESPATPSENLSRLKVRDMLCMGCGMEEWVIPTEYWIEDYLNSEVVHEPGKVFRYYSINSSMLGAIIRKLTGQGLKEYLTPRLFDKIGIDASHIKWMLMPDGMEVGSGGIFSTTEDNLRLMRLYMNRGVWDGNRILAEDYVDLAISKQIDTSGEAVNNPGALDNFVGYGFQIWMCRPKGVYRADGAMGQFSICFPDLDMIIAINETATGSFWAQRTLDIFWEFAEKIRNQCGILPDNNNEYEQLKNRLLRLSLSSPRYSPFSAIKEKISGKKYAVKNSGISLEIGNGRTISGHQASAGFEEFIFWFGSDTTVFSFHEQGRNYTVEIGMQGERRKNILKINNNQESIVLLSGAWEREDTFILTARWVETCFEKEITFTFQDYSVHLESSIVTGESQIGLGGLKTVIADGKTI